uniref:thiol oxidase n=1 Tax=viral metagenome TaxID=1070528 RepID=A0A6C0B032_9ZZZZ|tara:strand:- start:1102 stop:1716 length:615 start_codon:yes stop_codon:yes gene_type:complete
MNKTIKNSETKSKKKKVFSKKHYSSGDGMMTSIWGPNMWHYLHTISFNYPVKPTLENKKYYKQFILNLQYTLPCKYCRINLKNNFKVHPLKSCHLKDRESFSKYIYRLHEIVNKMLNKKSNLTYCDVRERYEHFRSRCINDKKKLQNQNKLFKFKKTKKKKEKGCTEPLYGKKARCIINIVPQEKKGKTLKIDSKCIKKFKKSG